MDKASGRSLGDGSKIPAVGLGLYYTPPGAATYDIVSEALKLGYRCAAALLLWPTCTTCDCLASFLTRSRP